MGYVKEKWVKREERITSEKAAKIAKEFGVSREVVRIAASRGVTDFKAYFSTGPVSDGSSMLDMDKAVAILREALEAGENIRVMGDYDMDGIMSTHILVLGLTSLTRGLKSRSVISYAIPDRIMDGYGLNKRMVQKAFDEKVDVVLTCDNGISSFEALELARCVGMKVIVTDHHQVPASGGKDVLVQADAIVNPHRNGDPTPFKEICGAVVAYKLIACLFAAFKIPKEKAEKMFLGYAAFATITDVMPLKGENRNIVKRGLPLIRNNLGLSVLSAFCGFGKDGSLLAEDVGFQLGPCGNAAGRIGDVNDILKLLGCRNPKEAERLANKLFELNKSRKNLCAMAEETAIRQAAEMVKRGDRVLVVYIPNVHEGIIGIVAGRVREAFARPSFVFTGSNGKLKGSGRSTEKWNMYEHLLEAKGLMLGFGGHPTAAGVSVESIEKLDELRKFLNEHCGIPEEDLVNRIYYDMEIPITELGVPLIESLSALEPTGEGNERPVFFIREAVGTMQVIGKDYQTVRIKPRSCPATIMAFHNGEIAAAMAARRYGLDESDIRYGSPAEVKVSAVGKANINEYQGTKTPQMLADSYIFI